MKTLIENYNSMWEKLDPFEKEARLHISFIRIHPFEDGNGRTGRLLINYELLKNNLFPVVIEKEDRIRYFEYLRNRFSSSSLNQG